MGNEKFDYGVFETPEFKVFENFIKELSNSYAHRLADNKVIDPTNMEYVYCRFLEYQGIRTGLRVWLSLISFIKILNYRKKRSQRYVITMQSFIQGLTLPIKWLHYRRKEKNRPTSMTTNGEKVSNYTDLTNVAEILLKE